MLRRRYPGGKLSVPFPIWPGPVWKSDSLLAYLENELSQLSREICFRKGISWKKTYLTPPWKYEVFEDKIFQNQLYFLKWLHLTTLWSNKIWRSSMQVVNWLPVAGVFAAVVGGWIRTDLARWGRFAARASAASAAGRASRERGFHPNLRLSLTNSERFAPKQ